MKILFIIPGFNGGGAERQCLYIAQALHEKNIDVSVAFYYEGNYKFILDECKFKKYKLTVKSFYDPRNIIEILKLTKRIKPDIVFTWLPVIDVFYSLIKLLKPKLKWIVAERDSAYESNFRDNLRKKIIPLNADAIIANSTHGKLFWQNLDFNKSIYVISNIIKKPTSPVSQFEFSKGFILFIGRFEEQKNIEMTYSVFRKLNSKYKIKCIMIGQGSYFNKIKEDTIKRNISNEIRILSFQENISEYYINCEVFVSLSLHEGMPNTLIESVLFEKKVVVSNINEHKSILGQNFNYYVDFDESSNQVVDKIFEQYSRAYDFEDYRNAINYLSDFSDENISKKYIHTLNQVLKN